MGSRWKRVRVWRGVKGSRPQRYKRGWGWKRVPTWRERAMEAMDWALAHESAIHYRQERPFAADAIARRQLPLYADCSATVTQLCRAAGLPDPNGNGYSGRGYTETIRAHVPDCPLDQADVIVYGPEGRPDRQHVVFVYRKGRDPLTWSHGQEAGPILVPHSVEARVHGGYFTCHSLDELIAKENRR